MNYVFDLLNANEIECRIGTAKKAAGDNKGGVSLLLYKDARCDMARLDKTVGVMNWQRTHSRENANCTVSIWDDDKKMWVSKEDVGVASRTEAEKGIASDSFKRACVNWGIGRELYTSPFIWISGDPDVLKWERFKVKAIGYDENRCINALTIVDKRNKVVFQMGKIEEVEPDTPDESATRKDAPAEVGVVDKVPPVKANPVQEYIKSELSTMREMFCISSDKKMLEEFVKMRKSLIAGGVIPDIPSEKQTMEQAQDMIDAIYKNFKPSGDKK